jgi:hypothetical protein
MTLELGSCSYGGAMNNITQQACKGQSKCDVQLNDLLPEMKFKCAGVVNKDYPIYLAYTCYCKIALT